MAVSTYTINKGINAPIEFRGLKGQYIGYLGGGLAAILVGFVILYVAGVNTFLCLTIAAGSGTWLFIWVYKVSATYGPHGMMKKTARRMLPAAIKNNSRRCFMQKH